MNSGDLIRQRKNRIVYNSIQGQTKPENKTTPKEFRVVLQERLGPKRVYDGSVVALPACECGVITPFIQPNVTAFFAVSSSSLLAGTDTGALYSSNGQTFDNTEDFGEKIVAITIVGYPIVTSTHLYTAANTITFTTPTGVTINAAVFDSGGILFLATTAGVYFRNGMAFDQVSDMDTSNISAIALGGTYVYISIGNIVYSSPIAGFSASSTFTDTGATIPAPAQIRFLVFSNSTLYIATDTTVYKSVGTLPTITGVIDTTPSITGTISCLIRIGGTGNYPWIGTSTGQVLNYFGTAWDPLPSLPGTVNTISSLDGKVVAGTSVGIFQYASGTWTQLLCNP